MTRHEFIPPAQSVDVIEIGTYPDGRVCSLTGLVMDGVGRAFTITLMTAGRLASDSIELPEEAAQLLDADHEPIFVVPGNEIEPTDIDTIVQGIHPDLLSQYLVAQEN